MIEIGQVYAKTNGSTATFTVTSLGNSKYGVHTLASDTGAVQASAVGDFEAQVAAGDLVLVVTVTPIEATSAEPLTHRAYCRNSTIECNCTEYGRDHVARLEIFGELRPARIAVTPIDATPAETMGLLQAVADAPNPEIAAEAASIVAAWAAFKADAEVLAGLRDVCRTLMERGDDVKGKVGLAAAVLAEMDRVYPVR